MSHRFDARTDAELCEILRAESHRNRHMTEMAFRELYRRHSPRLNAYCLRMTGDTQTAKDLFQEAFSRFYKSATDPNGQPMTNVPAFLLRIARNLHLNAKRDAKATVSVEDFHLSSTPHPEHEQAELLELIKNALELLDFEHREAFVLREYDGLPYAEIAEIVGTNEATAKTRVFRAKEKIRKILQPYLQDIARS